MGHRCCAKQKVKRGLWSPEEDEKLTRHITTFGHGSWSSVPKLAGLQRCGKSCRLRWINYLRPDLKKGSFTQDEEQIIIDVHRILGNRWAQIAKHLPGRTDNEVKNFWNSCIKKKLLSQGLDPQTHNLISSSNQKALSNKNSTSSFVVSHETQKQPISQKQPTSAFSILNSSSGHEITNICSDDQYIVNPPLLTPPYNAPNNISAVDQYKAPIIGGINSNDLTAAWTLRDQNSSSVENSTPNISSSSSSSVDIQNFFKSSLIFDDRCGIWDSGLQPFEAPKTVPEGDWKSLQGQVENKYQQQLPEENEKIWEMQNDNNFENYCLDNGFMDSALMTETLMCHQLSPEQYDLAWNY